MSERDDDLVLSNPRCVATTTIDRSNVTSAMRSAQVALLAHAIANTWNAVSSTAYDTDESQARMRVFRDAPAGFPSPHGATQKLRRCDVPNHFFFA
ncbi:hypothetical protein [Burkholderia lata]|uniref:Uncharacterized protein n=1 Tax=Burkholderia lata (strain ATCC 17760 / DSM 23089 / LMG 22485 / NCIMB 9086 / R18194 / 383) TaxID=482957 RepID=A0A6P2TSB8_BURL3|nr:hypothetical protein [Burkholderia lata]VWC60057.1 hypothetical protein BLA18109_01425 [Burkholderia lata]